MSTATREIDEASVTDFNPVSEKSVFPEFTSRRARQVYSRGGRSSQAMAALKTTIINGHCLAAKGYVIEEDATVRGRYHVHSPSNRSHVVDVSILPDGTVTAQCDETCEMYTIHGFCLHCEGCIVKNESAMRDFLLVRDALEQAYAGLFHVFGPMTVKYSIPTVNVPNGEDEFNPERDSVQASKPNQVTRWAATQPQSKGYAARAEEADRLRKTVNIKVADTVVKDVPVEDYIPQPITEDRFKNDWAD